MSGRAQDVERFLGCLERSDVPGAAKQIRELLARDVDLERVLEEVIRPAQVEVGRRWQSDEWSVAQEHAATVVTDMALSVVSATTAVRPTRSELGRVVVVCAEDEWHVLPARMTAERLRLAGWETTFLGGSVPGDHLARYLSDNPATAVAISATVPTNLPGAYRSIAAAHEAGMPALVGGAAFGTDARRARRLGADAWAPAGSDALETLSGWAQQPPDLTPTPDLSGEHGPLQEHRSDLVLRTVLELSRRFPPIADYGTSQLTHTHEDVGHILDFAAAALLVADDDVFLDFAPWLTDVLRVRDVPVEVVPLTLGTIADVLGVTYPDTVRLLRRAVEQHADDHDG